MILLDLAGTRKYVSHGDRALPEENQTWHKIRDLEEREMVRVLDGMAGTYDPETGFKMAGSGTRMYLTLKAAYLGTYEDHPAYRLSSSTGEPEAVDPTFDPDGRISDEFLSMVPHSVKQELYVAIQNRITMTEEEVGKPDAPPSVPPPESGSSDVRKAVEECEPSSTT